jgi:sulfoxide reductase heme-binding subunit YedZ
VATLSMRLQSPLRDRRGRISTLKAATFALIVVVPTFAILWPVVTDTAGGLPEILVVYTTGIWAAWLLVLSLCITPARRIFGLPQLIAIRRMLGVSAVVYTIAHFVVFLYLIRIDFGATFLREYTRPTIWVATLSTVGFLMLAATSLDSAVAKMGRWWNILHNATYVLTALGIGHFLLSRASTSGVPFLFSGIFFWLMAWRVLDRFKKGASIPWLTGLAFGVTIFNLGFQIVWLWLYRGRAYDRTLRAEIPWPPNYTSPFDYSLPTLGPAWLPLLILGLAVPLLAAIFARPAPGWGWRSRWLPSAARSKALGTQEA